MINHPELYGLDDSKLVQLEQGIKLTLNTTHAFEKLKKAAQKQDINIKICSAYRSFSRQLTIWNDKAQGKRVLLDKTNQAIDPVNLSAEQLVNTILHWTMLPGASRHHWGTDFDVYDGNQINKQALKLVTDEYQKSGPCYRLHQWLTQHAHDYGFYFPYQVGKSGVQAEPWHLSYFPQSGEFLHSFNIQVLRSVLASENLLLKPQILAQLSIICEQYVFRVATPPNTA